MSASEQQGNQHAIVGRPVPPFVERHYTTYLVCVALAGWSLASYDFNLLVLTFSDIAKSLHLAPGAIGLLGFVIYAAMFIITFLAGYGMDQLGRKWMWMFCLTAAAVFTGLTYFVQNYWQLAVVRALASGFANSELAISITLVNEQVPSARRGLLYSIVQGGWPVGVFLASGVYLLFNSFGWRMVFVFGVIPIICVIVGRYLGEGIRPVSAPPCDPCGGRRRGSGGRRSSARALQGQCRGGNQGHPEAALCQRRRRPAAGLVC